MREKKSREVRPGGGRRGGNRPFCMVAGLRLRIAASTSTVAAENLLSMIVTSHEAGVETIAAHGIVDVAALDVVHCASVLERQQTSSMHSASFLAAAAHCIHVTAPFVGRSHSHLRSYYFQV
jgi:hypothetical protein